MKILITGSNGFIGRHLVEALRRRPDFEVIGYDLGSPDADLDRGLRQADIVFHLAGVNRPQDSSEFKTGNADFTAGLCSSLLALGRSPLFVLSSSIQAAMDNPYGVSKRQAEEAIERWARGEGGLAGDKEGSGESEEATANGQGARAVIFRLKNVFGKWCRPNYNSVTATFCHNIAHDLPITISDPHRELELVYIDDVIEAFLGVAEERAEGRRQKAEAIEFREVPRSFKVTLGELAARIGSFRESRRTLVVPDFSDDFNRCLYATYLSYLDGPDFAYSLEQRTDPRGSLAEFVKSGSAGQIFVSRTKPGITRGNHYHHTKTEKFLVVEGEAIIRFRGITSQAPGAKREGQAAKGEGQGAKREENERTSNSELPTSNVEIIEHRVSGKEFKVVDIPPGYTHSIENVGNGELVTLFWASEVFDPQRPDTYPLNVLS